MSFGPYPLTLRQLQYAVAIAESLNFRKAAERCHVSQPSLSGQLAQMESALGVRLFERDKRRVLVTGAGREFIEHARRILHATSDLVEIARRTGDPFSGSLRVGVIPTVSPYLLPRLTPVLRAAYPRLSVRWIEEKTWILVRDLEAGGLDAALLTLEADIGDVQREIIARDPFVLVAPLGHPLAASTAEVEVAELRGATVFVLQDGHCFGEQAVAFCSNTSAHVDAFRTTSLTTLVQLVAGGAGVTLLPELALPQEVVDTQLRVRTFSEPAPARTLGLVWRKQYPFGATLREVAATMRQAYPAVRAERGTHSRQRGRRRPIATRGSSRRTGRDLD